MGFDAAFNIECAVQKETALAVIGCRAWAGSTVRRTDPVATTTMTALLQAATLGDVAQVRRLIDDGVDVNGVGFGDRTALHESAEHAHVDIVKYLLERGANVNARSALQVRTVLTRLYDARTRLM